MGKVFIKNGRRVKATLFISRVLTKDAIFSNDFHSETNNRYTPD